MWKSSIETYLGCDASYEDASIVIYGAPFDSTTSNRPGTRFASRAMRSESYGLETYSPYLDADLTDYAAFDAGDLTLCIGDASLALQEIERAAETFFTDNKLPLMVGGEHLVTLGAVRAAAHKYPDLHIIHFDAHADLREDYLGPSSPMRPSCGAARNCWATDASFSSASVPVSGKNSFGEKRMSLPRSSAFSALRKP